MYRTDFWTLWEGEGGMIWENGIETCILSCKKRIASLGSIQDIGCLGLVHWDDPERWYGEGGERGVQDWERVHPRWKRVFAMTSVFSWQNSVSLCPASFCTPRPNFPVTHAGTAGNSDGGLGHPERYN